MTFTNEALLKLNKKIGPRKDESEVKKTLANELDGQRDAWCSKIIEVAEHKGICMRLEVVPPEKPLAECDADSAKGEIRFTFPDAPFHGWWFSVKLDRPCLELSTKPATSGQYVEIQDLVQVLVFNTAECVGLSPHRYYGAGHIHIDARTGFNGDPVKLLNFMTGINNIGIWPFQNSRNMRVQSNPMAALPDSQRKKTGKGRNRNSEIRDRYRELVAQESEKFECRKEDPRAKGEAERDRPGRAIKGLLKRINSKIYPEERKKYQMLNTCHAQGRSYDEITLEIRAFDAQKSAGDLLLQLQLLEKALQRTRTDEVIEYNPPQKLKFENSRIRKEWVLCDDAIEELVPRIVDYFKHLEVGLSDYFYMLPMELGEIVMMYYNDSHRHVGSGDGSSSLPPVAQCSASGRSPWDGKGASQEKGKEKAEDEDGG